jgi:hypothetical protein
MRFRLGAALCGLAIARVAFGEPPQPHPSRGTREVERLAEFGPPEVVLDGSEYGARLHPHYADFDESHALQRANSPCSWAIRMLRRCWWLRRENWCSPKNLGRSHDLLRRAIEKRKILARNGL